MKRATQKTIGARKTPVQERSQATVEAILEAAIQVLAQRGGEHVTTTLIAQRAGVSVGTLYQYFLNKQTVLLGVLEMHLTKVVVALEEVCHATRGLAVAVMAERLVEAFVSAKMERPDASVALYAVSANSEANALMQRLRRRSLRALADMLATASDATFTDTSATTQTLYAAMAGATRAVLEGGATPKMVRSLREQLTVMCGAYLAAAGGSSAAAGVSQRR